MVRRSFLFCPLEIGSDITDLATIIAVNLQTSQLNNVRLLSGLLETAKIWLTRLGRVMIGSE